MTSIIKKISYLSIGRGTATISNIISLIVASRFLSLNDYATFRQTFLPYIVLVPILQLGIPGTLYYLLPRRKDKLNLVLESLLILSLTAFMFSLFLLIGGIGFLADKFNNPNLNNSLQWLIPYTFFQLPVNLLISVLVYEGKTKAVAIYSVISSVLLSTSIIFLVIKYHSYQFPVISKSLMPIILTSALFYIVIRVLIKTFIKELQLISNVRSILKISLPLGLAYMIGTLSLQLDKILVSVFFSPKIFAVYSNGAFEIPFIGVLTGSIGAVILAEMSDHIKVKNFTKCVYLFSKSATKTALFIFPLMIFFMYTANNIIILMFSSKYALSAIPFRIYLFMLPIRIIVFGSALIALGKNDVILKRSIVELILNLILSYLLLRLFGYIGVAIATISVVYLWSVPYNIYEISKGFKISMKELFEYKELLKIMIIAIFVSPIILLNHFINMHIFYRLLFSGFAYFTSLFFLYKKFNLLR